MTLPGAMLFGLGAGSCRIGQKCRLPGVCIVAASGWLVQFARRFAQEGAGWFLFVCDRAALGCQFLVIAVINRLFAVDRARGGAVWCQVGTMWVRCGCNVGAHNFAMCAPEIVPEECVESAGWWCRVTERSRSDGYADSRLAAVVSGQVERARAIAAGRALASHRQKKGFFFP